MCGGKLSVLSMAFAFISLVMLGSSLMVGVVQYLWSHLLNCISSLVAEISIVCCILSICTVFDVTPNKRVKWAEARCIWEPSI